MLPAGLVGHVRLRYLGTSAQKTRLVVDLIRGRSVDEAIATLRYTHKVVALEIGRALDSAVANARQRKPELDVDRLFVHTAFVDGGPSLKRIRPAPMGRAFRVQKRMCHVTIGLGETKVHRHRVSHHLGHDRGAPRPGLEDLLLVAPVHLLDATPQHRIHESALLDASRHGSPYLRRRTMYLSVRLLLRVFFSRTPQGVHG